MSAILDIIKEEDIHLVHHLVNEWGERGTESAMLSTSKEKEIIFYSPSCEGGGGGIFGMLYTVKGN